jgi:NADP+-dependent farnesol dehydrogenase
MSGDPGVGLVLGASAGIGAALTRRLAPTATRLHAASRRGRVDAGADGSVVAHRCDVRSHGQVSELFEAVGDPIDFVVNCVGVGFYAPLDDDYSTAWREMTETNLVGLANVLAVAYRTRPDIGTIINVSSMAAHRVSRTPGNIMYTATKTGARILLDDYRRRIRTEQRTTRIMSISPGFVSGTDFDDHFYRDAPHARTDLFASDGSMSPDEVARLIEYMLMTPPEFEITDWLVRPTTQIE